MKKYVVFYHNEKISSDTMVSGIYEHIEAEDLTSLKCKVDARRKENGYLYANFINADDMMDWKTLNAACKSDKS